MSNPDTPFGLPHSDGGEPRLTPEAKRDIDYIVNGDGSLNITQKVRLLINPFEPSFLWEKSRQWSLVLDVVSAARKQKGIIPLSGMFALFSFARSQVSFIKGIPLAFAALFRWVLLSPPAKNDYHIARWCLTGDDADVRYVCDNALKAPRNSDGSGVAPRNMKEAAFTSAAWSVAAIGSDPGASLQFQLVVLRLYPTKHEMLLTPYPLPQ